MSEKIIIRLNMIKTKKLVDIEIPTDISARELIVGLNEAYRLGIDTNNIKECYLKCEKPIALLRGNKTIKEYGLRQGSEIVYTE